MILEYCPMGDLRGLFKFYQKKKYNTRVHGLTSPKLIPLIQVDISRGFPLARLPQYRDVNLLQCSGNDR